MDIKAKAKAKELPSSPGVYLMKDSLENIIYVGKSKNLKSRVGSYFINSKAHSPKVIKLVKNLKDFDYIVTDTEFEALLLECSLIKEIKPPYNRLMKNPKGYCYIEIDLNGKYADIKVCNHIDSEVGKLYFGPYINKNTVEKALSGIKEHLGILCTNSGGRSSGCLKYSMGLCLGMCSHIPSKEQFDQLADKIINLLRGTDITVIEEMEGKMNLFAENYNFEQAAKYRDNINSVNHLLSTAKILRFIEQNRNIALLEFLDDKSIKLFLIRYNKLLFSKTYNLEHYSTDQIVNEFKNWIIEKFGSVLESTVKIGRDEIDEVHIIYSYLKSRDSSCKYVTIEDQWIERKDNLSIEKAVEKLLSNKL